MQRGEVWWAELEPPVGRRPVVLLSRNESYAAREIIIIAPITTRIRHILSEVPLSIEDGLPRNCVVNIDSITTVKKASLSERQSILSSVKMKAISAAIHFALGLDD